MKVVRIVPTPMKFIEAGQRLHEKLYRQMNAAELTLDDMHDAAAYMGQAARRNCLWVDESKRYTLANYCRNELTTHPQLDVQSLATRAKADKRLRKTVGSIWLMILATFLIRAFFYWLENRRKNK